MHIKITGSHVSMRGGAIRKQTHKNYRVDALDTMCDRSPSTNLALLTDRLSRLDMGKKKSKRKYISF